MADFSTLQEWLDWQSGLSAREIDLGLERVRRVHAALDLTRPKLVLTVGGTNGKGSAVALLERLARAAGRKTGTYTSPHLSRYNERIRIDGAEASDAAIMEAFRAVETCRDGELLTYFEYGTLGALVAFERSGVDTVLLEVGLGGRLDATNVLGADGVVITSVALDHEEWLGDDIESIAGEKAGIMRPGRPAVFGGAEVPRAILEKARQTGADLRLRGRDYDVEDNGRDWHWRGDRLSIGPLPQPSFGGAEQIDNAASVLALLESLRLDDWLDTERLRAALTAAGPPGRQQRIVDGPEWWLDVAHNTAAAIALARALAAEPVRGTTFAVVGMLDDKDAGAFSRALAPVVDHWIATPLDAGRAHAAPALAADVANATSEPCLIADSLSSALAHVRRLAGEGDRVLVAGSFFLVGPALEELGLYSRLA